MNHRLYRGFALCLFACGVERDREVWQAGQHTTGGEDSGSDSSGSSETGEPADASSTTTSTTDDTTSSTSTSTGPVDAITTSETTGDTGDSTTGAADVCGDGLVQPGEECDDPGDLHCFNCYRDRRVFVTSEGVQGDWAAAGIDAWCNHLAAKAGLITDNQPRFKTWASTSMGSAADRLFHSPGRYVMVNDLVFAESWDDLVAGNLLNPLNVDENSQTRDYPVWTGTAPDGSAVVADDLDFCTDWTDDAFTKYAHYGYSWRIDSDWTLYDDQPVNPTVCGAWGSLYCFESP
jgi:hypothetical protein